MEEDNLKKLTELGDAIIYLKSDLLSINTYEEFFVMRNNLIESINRFSDKLREFINISISLVDKNNFYRDEINRYKNFIFQKMQIDNGDSQPTDNNLYMNYIQNEKNISQNDFVPKNEIKKEIKIDNGNEPNKETRIKDILLIAYQNENILNHLIAKFVDDFGKNITEPNVSESFILKVENELKLFE